MTLAVLNREVAGRATRLASVMVASIVSVVDPVRLPLTSRVPLVTLVNPEVGIGGVAEFQDARAELVDAAGGAGDGTADLGIGDARGDSALDIDRAGRHVVA